MAAGAVLLSGLSLALLPRGIGYDPRSWLIWGREIDHLALDTRDAATAVKPFPILVDVLLAPVGAAAPLLWLLVARAGTVLSLMLAFRVAHRLGGVVAGVVASVGLALAAQFLGYLSVAGMSEPLATAALLGAVDCHIRSHRGAAFVFLVVAGLLRPEAWPAVIGYCLWLAYAGRARRWLVAAVVAVAVPAAWFLIDWFGSGQLSRSAHAATQTSQGGPLLSRVPALATLQETWALMSGPVVVLFLVGVALAVGTWVRRGRPGPLVWVGAVALGWLFVDAMLAQGRLATGAPRYLLPGVGLACVVAGCVVAAAVRALQHRLGHTGWSRVALAAVAVGLVAVCVPRIVFIGGQVGSGIREGYRAQALQTELPSAVATAGGRHTILGCGEVSTGPFQVPMLAWQLDVPVGRVAVAHAGTTGTVIELGRPTVSKGWTVLDSCPASHRR